MLTAAGRPVRQARVHAVPRTGKILLGYEIRGGKPELAATLVAVGDLAAYLERGAEEVRRLSDLAGEQEAANVAGGDDLTVDLEQRVHDRGEANVGGEQPRIALGLVAEAEVLADRDLGGAERADEHVVDELIRAARRELTVERDHDQLRHPQRSDQLRLDLERRQQLRSVLRGNDRDGVGLEREHAVGARDHLAMATMHTVERADSDAPLPALYIWQASDLHGREAYCDRGACGSMASARSRAISGGSLQGTPRAGGATASATWNCPIAVRLSCRQ